jgi:hypothetical protein
MLSAMFESFCHFFGKRLAGMGACSNCSCNGYEKDIQSDNDYCTCGHSYGSHA